MQDVIKTIQLENDKSSFLLELVKHANGALFVEISQVIHANNGNKQSIKINPSILVDFIAILQNYDAAINRKNSRNSRYLTEEQKDNIASLYLKGISIKDLSLQYDQTEGIIEAVLRKKCIEIVAQEMPAFRNRRKK